ncbi:energy transducer TonB [Parvibium lacunae]|uniref:TonB family protein n=1 Tax=Parvibium lacunae TaxID=1888893 RepID=A0A368KZI4_9BURK|nr:TonB family protein [Parvibium lacunae]RCS56726.1 TonB family protein [Parvibium lacunae]
MANYQEKSDRALKWALIFSVLAHAVLLAVRFVAPDTFKLKPSDNQLEIVLVNSKTASRPNSPKVLAQANQEGGGNADAGRATSPLPNSGQVSDGDSLQASMRRQQELEDQQRKLLAQLKATPHKSSATQDVKETPPTPTLSSTELLNQSKLLARMEAQIEQRVEDYQKRPKKRFFGVDALAAEDVLYVEQWRRKVEQVGTLNYPAEARGKLYGTLVVSVYLYKDGSLAEVHIDKSSGHTVLDGAVKKILRMAAPFAAIPDNVMKGNDLFVITRRWDFINDQLTTKQ